MILLKVTADRRADKLVARDRSVLCEIPDDPHYWDLVCNIILECMERDGVIEPRDKRSGETPA